MTDPPAGPRLTRVMLADGTQCELAQLSLVLDRICAALDAVPAAQRRDVGRALLSVAVAYIGGDGPATLPSRDSRA